MSISRSLGEVTSVVSGIPLAAEPGPGQPGFHLPTLGLTVATLGRSLYLQPLSWPVLGNRGGKPRPRGSQASAGHLSAHPSGVWGGNNGNSEH